MWVFACAKTYGRGLRQRDCPLCRALCRTATRRLRGLGRLVARPDRESRVPVRRRFCMQNLLAGRLGRPGGRESALEDRSSADSREGPPEREALARSPASPPGLAGGPSSIAEPQATIQPRRPPAVTENYGGHCRHGSEPRRLAPLARCPVIRLTGCPAPACLPVVPRHCEDFSGRSWCLSSRAVCRQRSSARRW